MSRQATPLFTLPVVAAADLTAETFVTAAGAVATAAGNAVGVLRADTKSGLIGPVDVLGTAIATAGAAIAGGAHVEVGAAGKCVTLAAGKAVGIALDAASADGDKIEVLLIPN